MALEFSTAVFVSAFAIPSRDTLQLLTDPIVAAHIYSNHRSYGCSGYFRGCGCCGGCDYCPRSFCCRRSHDYCEATIAAIATAAILATAAMYGCDYCHNHGCFNCHSVSAIPIPMAGISRGVVASMALVRRCGCSHGDAGGVSGRDGMTGGDCCENGRGVRCRSDAHQVLLEASL